MCFKKKEKQILFYFIHLTRIIYDFFVYISHKFKEIIYNLFILKTIVTFKNKMSHLNCLLCLLLIFFHDFFIKIFLYFFSMHG